MYIEDLFQTISVTLSQQVLILTIFYSLSHIYDVSIYRGFISTNICNIVSTSAYSHYIYSLSHIYNVSIYRGFISTNICNIVSTSAYSQYI